MSYAVGTWVYNTRTGEYGIITSSGGFMSAGGTQPYSSAVPRIYFPPGSAGTVDTTPSNSQPNVWGGIDPMGAGIAGVNTPARKVGRATKESAKAKRKQTNLNKKINEKYTIVSSILLATKKTPEVKLDWRIVTKNIDKPLIIDVVIEGVSLARVQREEFNSIIQNKNINGLINNLIEFANK